MSNAQIDVLAAIRHIRKPKLNSKANGSTNPKKLQTFDTPQKAAFKHQNLTSLRIIKRPYVPICIQDI